MPAITSREPEQFDRTNAILAGVVFVISFIVYAITVQRSFSFWDCGEFIACSATLGVPHPPGTPLFVLVGRVFSMFPFVEDVSYRINYISVISSALTAMFSYLLIVKLVRHFFKADEAGSLSRLICYAGGVAGAFFVAFSATNWSNAVEAEVYGLGLALSVAIVWLTVKYFENRGTPAASRIILLVMYLAMVGVGIHMTVFLVVPVCAIFFILNERATARDYMMICVYAILELTFIMLFSNGRAGYGAFMAVSAILGIVLFALLWRKINWGILIAIMVCSSIMISFSLYLLIALPFGALAILGLAYLSKQYGWKVDWQVALGILLVGLIGFSVHMYIPIRSSQGPRIDENNPSRDFRTFVNFLDRKQYGQVSMSERMFERRGSWSHQLGRHANMGFWSYFEEQYSAGGWWFVPLFLLGLLGMVVAIFKRLEIGLPYFTLFLLCSVGLVLYMNFADGPKYSFETGDAYLEVRNRDYFFTPAFVFFGIALGMGVSAVMTLIRDRLSRASEATRRTAVYASCVLVLLPSISLARNFHACDRSNNYLPYIYAKNILDTCEENAILFTSGDNDTFPVWCLQEAYNYRKDVRVVNLSLLNTDWYTYQMKERYGVEMPLEKDQIIWDAYQVKDNAISDRPFRPFDNLWDTFRWALGKVTLTNRPARTFTDQARRRRAYLYPMPYQGGVVKVQDMMVDEIVLANLGKVPVYFSSAPYGESPLRLRDRSVTVGLLQKIELEPENSIDVDKSYDLFMNQYTFTGYENSEVFRDDNATGVFLGVGMGALRIYDELLRQADTTRAINLMNKLIDVYPEFWQTYVSLAGLYTAQGDTAKPRELYQQLHDTLEAFLASNPGNYYYRQDLGLVKAELGNMNNDEAEVEEGIKLMWEGYLANPNSNFGFRKLITALNREGRMSDIREAGRIFSQYKMNLTDPVLQQILGAGRAMPTMPER